MIIAEENKAYDEVLVSKQAPYLASLARRFGTATRMHAGYPTRCPSLAAYIILTSGTDHGICDDRPPHRHRLGGDNLFQQIEQSGRQWRGYAESMPANCTLNDAGELYLVRHSPAPYYLTARKRCQDWQLPLGTVHSGALHDDLTSGTLPVFAFVSPNACNDMHGSATCPNDQVATGDTWLSHWIPLVLAGPDFRSGRLAVIITWDEGSLTDNHIPTVVLSVGTQTVSSATLFTHCSTLRTVEEILRLPLLGCAAAAASLRAPFAL
jgi:hypothetical protein